MTEFSALLVLDDGGPASRLVPLAPEALDAWLRTASERHRSLVAAHRFKAAAGEVLLLPGDAPAELLALAGLGSAAPGPFALAAAASRLPPGRWRSTAPLPLLGWLLAQHHFTRYKAATNAGPRMLLASEPVALRDAVAMAEATALARDLIDTPAADMGPAELAAAVAAQGRQFGATTNTIVGEALIDANFPLIHAVGRAAAQAPRLIDLAWGDPAHPRLTIIGKGITFDSGGLNIKPGNSMGLMKKDMGGAATALALARLVMQAGLPVRLRLLVAAAENSISANAMRPGDIIASRAGKTIEITNTDAEGRLVLADALALAAEEKPALILDFATLTGAARVALGPELPALFTPDDALAADFYTAAGATHDPLARLPLWAPYADMLKSPIADMVNSADGPMAGAITAALFLKAFVPAGQPWAHFDTFAWNSAARPGRPKGGEALALRASFALLTARFGARFAR
ncbi:leucyl aminopeptidase [Polymorphobacter multimanifer]|uniref:Leucyl aminopeptidase n=1 Tax=Polymorphobacter multimanifer TaxID=1070431 RepID=A0A841L5Z4_9SPHN|nr:leucyl aminopeptidase family protein [Polymorphobacter multimanifer]MBB6226931.1 leucyl aminopeptidase [Polymorphobacter multimanifer]